MTLMAKHNLKDTCLKLTPGSGKDQRTRVSISGIEATR